MASLKSGSFAVQRRIISVMYTWLFPLKRPYSLAFLIISPFPCFVFRLVSTPKRHFCDVVSYLSLVIGPGAAFFTLPENSAHGLRAGLRHPRYAGRPFRGNRRGRGSIGRAQASTGQVERKARRRSTQNPLGFETGRLAGIPQIILRRQRAALC